ncbi:MAG: hypothetical protein VYD70_03410 [Planctomycetota bacterium]|nr:hypothetical protein [Planctomycetota bacterium]
MPLGMLIFLTLLHSHAPATDDPKVPILIKGAVAPLPYSRGERHEWEWTHDGIPVGKTTIQLLAPKEDQPGWTLDARLRWSRQGRSIDLRQLTSFLSPSLKPISTRKERRIEALGAGSRRTVVACEVIDSEARIVVQNPAEGTQVDQILPFADGTVLLENQCFEHWLLISALLYRAEGDGTEIAAKRSFSALIPSEYRLLQLKLSQDRHEKAGKDTLIRWNVTCSDFEAKIWTGPGGTLERYRQGPVEIRRIPTVKSVPSDKQEKNRR